MKMLTAGLVMGCVIAAGLGSAAAQGVVNAPDAGVTAFGKLPLYFVENRGVYPDAVRYYIQGADKTLFFTDYGVTIALKGKQRGWTVKLGFVGANADARPVGLDPQQAVFSYFKGPEKDWKAGLPTFSKIIYRDLWPGIDLVYDGTVNKLKYEFRVAPGADPQQIRLQYRGATSVTATDAGALRVVTPEGSFEDAPPLAWQEIGGKRIPVEMAYALGKDDAFGFTVGDYDRTRPLILDPAVIVYCGYIGGSHRENARAVAVDAAGCVYLTGNTTSDETTAKFPVTVGPDLTYNELGSNADAWVAKLDPSGRNLIYCGYIGGAAWDSAFAIAIDGAGCAYVTGYTMSDKSSFPVTKGAWDESYNGGYNDVFVAKVSASGSTLVYCTYIGGANSDEGRGIAVDSAGRAIVTGWTDSDENTFPFKTGPGPIYQGNFDVFVACVASDGSKLDYCGYIGGTGEDCKGAPNVPVAVDRSGNAYIAGWTNSHENSFPVLIGPDLTHNGGWDAFVAKVSPTGSMVYCGYIGGSGWDSASTTGHGIAVDAAGCAYVASTTTSDQKTFPVLVGPDLTHNGGSDAFVAKVNAAGTGLVYCGYVGGTRNDESWGLAVDAQGCAYLIGNTPSTENQLFPVTTGPDLTHNHGGDAFVAKVDPTGKSLVYCGYVGGQWMDYGYGIAVDSAGNAYLAGGTKSDETTFPVQGGPSTTLMGARDAFIAKIALLDGLTTPSTPRPGSTVTLSLAAVEARGLRYQVGTSLGTGPIGFGTRAIGLSIDGLFTISVGGLWPHIFLGYSGTLDGQGKATAKIVIPGITALIGQKLHTAFITLDPAWPAGIRSVSETRTITVVK